MAFPTWIYPEWNNPDDFDGNEDYAEACAIAEESWILAGRPEQ